MTNSEQARRPRAFRGLDADMGPALPLSSADASLIVEQAVARALAPEVTVRPRGFGLRKLSLAAIVVVTSAAAAGIVHRTLQRTEAPSAPAVHAPQQQTKGKSSNQKPQPRAAEIGELPATDLQPEPSAVAAASVVAAAAAHASTVAAPEVAIVDELSAANDLRRRAEWRAAEAAYRSIAVRYPRAEQAAVAQLAAAELRLDHLGDAAGALRMYQAVPRGSALGVEALFGISRAARALGNRNAEANALRALLDEYPASLQADGARSRLKQLSAELTP